MAFCSRHCADARGAPTLLLICGAKLKVTVDGDLALWLGPPVMVALVGVLLMNTSMSLRHTLKDIPFKAFRQSQKMSLHSLRQECMHPMGSHRQARWTTLLIMHACTHEHALNTWQRGTSAPGLTGMHAAK